MGSGAPKTLNGIRFIGHEIKDCDFKVHTDPPTGKQGGYLSHNINFNFEYQGKEVLFLYSILEMDAFLGDAQKQNAKDEKVFTLKLQVLLKYSLKEATSTLQQIKRYEWHFKSQAMLLLHIISRDIMKDTRFRVLDNILSLPIGS